MLITPLSITSQDPSAQTAVNYLSGKTNFIYAGEHLYGDSLQAMLKELCERANELAVNQVPKYPRYPN